MDLPFVAVAMKGCCLFRSVAGCTVAATRAVAKALKASGVRRGSGWRGNRSRSQGRRRSRSPPASRTVFQSTSILRRVADPQNAFPRSACFSSRSSCDGRQQRRQDWRGGILGAHDARGGQRRLQMTAPMNTARSKMYARSKSSSFGLSVSSMRLLSFTREIIAHG